MNLPDSDQNDLNALKIQIKKWEKKFEKENGHKASRNDIDNDEQIKQIYITYWKKIKKKKKSIVKQLENNIHNNDKTWGSNCKKEILVQNTTNKKKTKSKLLNALSNKLMKNSLKETPKKKYSLNRKIKNKNENEMFIALNGHQVNLMNRKENNKLIDSSVLNTNILSSDLNKNMIPTNQENFISFQNNFSLNLENNSFVNLDNDFTNFENLTETKIENYDNVPILKNYEIMEIDEDKKNKDSFDLTNVQNINNVDLLPQTTGFDNVFISSNDITNFSTGENNSHLLESIQNDINNEVNDIISKLENQSNDVNAYEFKDDFVSLINDNNENNDIIKTKNTNNKKQTKVKRKKVAKMENNFRRLETKKKVFVKGYKKFNINKYKRNEWKKLRNNKCYKCGENDHWAKDCKNNVHEDIDNDLVIDELDDIVNNNSIINETRPLFEDGTYDLNMEVTNALNALGFISFKANQREVIERILLEKSVLMISSTGTGKSLCYQIPAYIYSKIRKYITVVISPLISLMEDQLKNLPKPLEGGYLHSGLSESLKKAQMEKIKNCKIHVLFLSPEYILIHYKELFLLPTIGFVCIDEAHCFSEWSNNFRPSYLQFFRILKEKLKIKTFLALTATSNRSTTIQILKNMDMTFNDVIGSTKIPDNLTLTVSRDLNKDFALIDLLKSERFFNLKSIIIYCSRREITERLATLIRIEMKNFKTKNNEVSWDAQAYHAGLTFSERKIIQKSFMIGETRVVVATIAFGMGINKSDVDGIIHFNLPKTFENYVQEIGRAGRNGNKAQCHVFLDNDGSDLFEQQKHIFSNSLDKINIRKLILKVFKSCKCIKLRDLTLDEDDPILNSNNIKRCPGHENSFPIKETTVELDIKEETLLTILIFLELNLKKFKIKVLNNVLANCTVSCYKGGSQLLEKLAQKYLFIALPLAKYKKENPKFQQISMISFPYIEVSSMLGQQSLHIKNQLQNLEWSFDDNNRKIPSKIRVVFDNKSFHVITPGDLSEEEIYEITQIVTNYNKSQEIMEIKKLKKVYETFKDLSQSKCTKKVNYSKSNRLKKILNEYFDLNKQQEFDELTDIKNLNQIFEQEVILKETNTSDLSDARRNVRDFINIHSDQHFTPRAVARILQGISSPRYPVEVWGNDKRFWRNNIRMDFNQLMKIASEEIIRIKCHI